MSDLDPKLTFESFVVGPANRLAAAAARRAADSPGTSYNPLFIYSASGLGKSHILNAIAHQSAKTPGIRVEYMALEKYLERLESAIAGGAADDGSLFRELDILLLDDVQFLTGQPEAQEMLLRTLDELSAAGNQIVLASDRPPADINGLDARLLSRFSGGLIVDIGPPEYETRVAIVRKKAEERGQTLEPGVAEALGKHPFRNVRELGGGLNKVLATQELEERRITLDEMAALVGIGEGSSAGPVSSGEFDAFLGDLIGTVADVVEETEDPWRKAFRETIDSAEREGFSVLRLDPFQNGPEPENWESIIDQYRTDVARLREIDDELDRLGNPWPEAAGGMLKDPDRIDEAEALLNSVRERQRPFPKLGGGPKVEDLAGFEPIAIKASTQLIADAKPEYNPLYMWSHDASVCKTLLGAVGRSYQATHPGARTAVTSLGAFAQDFIRALGEGVAGAWRERWWTVDLLLVYGVEAIADTERAQDEFFHLFEALKRRGARILLVADRAPAGIGTIDDRLRSRFEGGLVLQLEQGTGTDDLVLIEEEVKPLEGKFLTGFLDAAEAEVKQAGEKSARKQKEKEKEPLAPVVAEAPKKKGGAWFPSAENVVLQWPKIEDLLIEELE